MSADPRVTAALAAADAGMQAAADHADPRLVLAVDKVIAELNASGKPWSVNDARDALPVACSGLVGARVKAASMRKPVEMVKVGEEPSTLRSTHAKGVARWIGVQS